MSQNTLRILHTCFSFSWGGLEIHSVAEAEKMLGRGYDVRLACCRGSRIESEAGARGIPLLPLSVRGYFNPSALVRFSRFLAAGDIRLVHCQQSKDLALVTPAIRFSGKSIPVILSKRVGSYVMKKTAVHRFTYSSVRRVLAISEVIRRNVIETTPVPPEQVITLHHGIDTTLFMPGEGAETKIRREFGMSEDTLVVGFVGRFSPGKGHEEFLEAASLLLKHHPNVRFVVVGEASRGEEQYADRIRALSRSLGLDQSVLFTGFRSDVRDVMSVFDIFAFPSHAEAFGSVLVEAMALGKPVVSSNCDGALDIVVDGTTGIFVNPGDGPGLAEAIGRLINDQEMRERFGRAGRQRAVEFFDQKRMLDSIEKVYREVLGER
ncbi:MAG: glycosyltransferase family 4 protein [Ignavibacteria bacterium]|nr:glycosyltransferase family 4 protein [Ignavibacteria bacterium]